MSGVAIITGSGRGIGAATAKLAAKRGYVVCVNYLKNEERADEVVAGLGDRLQKMIPTLPMGRLGTAEECAEAILWLMSGEAAYMIGGILTLSGGR